MERWQGKQGKEPYNYNFCWCWVDAINLNLLASKIYWIRYVFVIWLLWLFGYWRAEADTSLMKHSSSWNTWLWLISISIQSIKIQMSHSGTVCLAWIVVNTRCEEKKQNAMHKIGLGSIGPCWENCGGFEAGTETEKNISAIRKSWAAPFLKMERYQLGFCEQSGEMLE